MSKKFVIGKWTIDSQKDLDTIVKHRLSVAPRDIEFEDDFLITMINTLHEGVRKHKQTLTKLKAVTFHNQGLDIQQKYRGNLFITGYFVPYNKWHGVTIYPYKKNDSKEAIAKEILRLKWSKIAPDAFNAVCEVCGNPVGTQQHHDNIEFKEIAKQCIHLFSEEDLQHDWWNEETPADKIPDNHPAVLKMIELHKDVKYIPLCKDHHKEAHRNKKKENIE
jgi:hypothetical protein